VISALELPSAFETARRIRGRSGSLSAEGLLDELLDALLLDEPDDELSELEAARRNRGRSGSLSSLLLDVPLDLLLGASSELEAARRNCGRLPLLVLPPDEALDELLEELSDALPEGLPGRGCVGLSIASEAAECSSGVPSFMSVIVTA
jgi:hypothetical protein